MSSLEPIVHVSQQPIRLSVKDQEISALLEVAKAEDVLRAQQVLQMQQLPIEVRKANHRIFTNWLFWRQDFFLKISVFKMHQGMIVCSILTW